MVSQVTFLNIQEDKIKNGIIQQVKDKLSKDLKQETEKGRISKTKEEQRESKSLQDQIHKQLKLLNTIDATIKLLQQLIVESRADPTKIKSGQVEIFSFQDVDASSEGLILRQQSQAQTQPAAPIQQPMPLRHSSTVVQPLKEESKQAKLRENQQVMQVNIIQKEEKKGRVEQPQEDSKSEGREEEIKEEVQDLSKTDYQCQELMRQVKNMPECFEKSLIRIIYMISLLKNRSSKDIVLFSEYEEERIQQLKTDLGNIQKQMKLEKHDAVNAIELLIKKTIDHFKLNKHPNCQYEQYQIELCNMLKQHLKVFNFQEFFQLLSLQQNNSLKIDNKSIILLLGTTGAGKSTLIQYLFGAPMVKKGEHIQAAEPIHQNLREFVSSARMASVTRYLHAIEVSFMNDEDDEEKIMLIDTPGFGDTQNVEVDISNTLGIIQTVSRAKKVHPVLIFSKKNQGGRAEIMKNLIEFYSMIIKNITNTKESINFFFSHYEQSTNMSQLMTDIIVSLSSYDLTQPYLKDVLTHMQSKAEKNELVILDPLDGNYQKVIKMIVDTPPIINPKNAFNLKILDRSQNYLDRQVALHDQAIERAVQALDIDLAMWKINEIEQLAKTFEACPGGGDLYRKKYQSIVEKVIKIRDEKVKSATDLIKRCMMSGNLLEDQDILKIQEYSQFVDKISPLIDSFKTKPDEKKGSQIQSDQKQFSLINDAISKCEEILNSLKKNHKVNEDQWVKYIEKAIRLATAIDQFKKLEDKALDSYKSEFLQSVKMVQEIMKNTNIKDYSEISLIQSQETRNEAQLNQDIANLNINTNFNDDGQNEEMKSDSDLDLMNQSTRPPSTLPSSDSDANSNAPQQIVSKINREKPRHIQFGEMANIVIQGFEKIRLIEKPDFVSNLNSFVEQVITLLNKLEEKAKPHFQFHQHDGRGGFNRVGQEDVVKARQALTMIENFDIVCKPISSRLGEITSKSMAKYIKKCTVMFDHHKDYLTDQLNSCQKDSKEVASDLKERFDQILLLRQIPQIEKETNIAYLILDNLMKTSIKVRKDTVITTLEAFNEFSLVNQVKEDKKSVQKIFIRLKEQISGLKALAEADSENDDMLQFGQVQSNFELLIEKLIYEVSSYQNLNEKHYQNVKPISLIYEQIKKLVEHAKIIGIDLKWDIGLEWLRSIKETFEKMNQFLAERMIGQLMILSDYKKFDLFTNYLHEFIKGPIDQSVTLVLNDINTKLLTSNLIEPRKIHTALNEALPQQFQKQKETFDLIFKELLQMTTFDITLQENTLQKSESSAKKDLKVVADEIKMLFKLANEVKTKYKYILKIILDAEQEANENYLEEYYTNQFKNHFFDQLDRNKINIQSRRWIQVKLMAMKELNDMDRFFYPQGQLIANNVYQLLVDKYYPNIKNEVTIAQQKFTIGAFNEIREQLEIFSQSKNDEHGSTIVNKIKELLNDKAKSIYEIMSNYMCDDLCLTDEETKIIATNSGLLMKIESNLKGFVNIVGCNDITTLIKDKILDHFSRWFTHISAKVDKLIKDCDFKKAFQKIDEQNRIFFIINQNIGFEIKAMEEFNQLLDQSTCIQDKKKLIKQEIERVIEEQIKRDPYLADQNPQAKKIYENLYKIDKNDMPQKLLKFEQDLIAKYINEKNNIDEKLQYEEDEEERYSLRRNAQRLRDSLSYMPTRVYEQMAHQFNGLFESHMQEDKMHKERKNQVIQCLISKIHDPQELSQSLKVHIKAIKEEQEEIIKQSISKKFQEILTVVNQFLNQQRIQEVIQVQIPKLKEYLEDPVIQNYVPPGSKLVYLKILGNINKQFQNAINELTNYFTQIHDDNSDGEEESKTFEQHNDERVLLSDPTASLKIVRGVLICLYTHKDLVLKECVVDMEIKFKEFLVKATELLSKSKSQQQHIIKDSVMQQVLASISNIKKTNIFLNQDLLIHSILPGNNQQLPICAAELAAFATHLTGNGNIAVEKREKTALEWIGSVTSFINISHTQEDDSDHGHGHGHGHKSSGVNQLMEQFDSLSLTTKKKEKHKNHKDDDISHLMKKAKKCIDKITAAISTQEGINNIEEIDLMYKKMKEMQTAIENAQNAVSLNISTLDSTVSSKLSTLQALAHSHYSESLNLQGLISVFLQLEQMKTQIPDFQDKVQRSIEEIMASFITVQNQTKNFDTIAELENQLKETSEGLSEAFSAKVVNMSKT